MVYKSGQIFLPFCHNSRVWRTDRRTDRILIARPRLHSMQRGKNYFLTFISCWCVMIFTALHAMQTRSSDEKAVRLQGRNQTSKNVEAPSDRALQARVVVAPRGREWEGVSPSSLGITFSISIWYWQNIVISISIF